jgi:hypothetical protein
LEQRVLEVAEVVGCLRRSSSGTWILADASGPVVSATQSTSSEALTVAKAKRLGNRRYQLLGVRLFSPSRHEGDKVAIKGILVDDSRQSRLNVTSLQTLATECAQ